MDKKNETFIELTPEQMAGVTGGASRTADCECPKALTEGMNGTSSPTASSIACIAIKKPKDVMKFTDFQTGRKSSSKKPPAATEAAGGLLPRLTALCQPPG